MAKLGEAARPCVLHKPRRAPRAKIARRAPRARSRKYSATEAKIDEIQMLFVPFTYYQKGPFSAANTRAAYARLSQMQIKRAPARGTPKSVDWADYFMNKHLPGDGEANHPVARRALEARDEARSAPMTRSRDARSRRWQSVTRIRSRSRSMQEGGLSRITYEDVDALTGASRTARRLRRTPA